MQPAAVSSATSLALSHNHLCTLALSFASMHTRMCCVCVWVLIACLLCAVCCIVLECMLKTLHPYQRHKCVLELGTRVDKELCFHVCKLLRSRLRALGKVKRSIQVADYADEKVIAELSQESAEARAVAQLPI